MDGGQRRPFAWTRLDKYTEKKLDIIFIHMKIPEYFSIEETENADYPRLEH